MSGYSAAILADSPALYYRLGEGSGNALDSSGNGKDASPTGTLTRGSASLVPSDSADLSCTFGGGNFTNANAVDPSAQAMTVEAWVNPSNTSSYRRIAGQTTAFNKGLAFGINSSGKWLLTTLGVADNAFATGPTASVTCHVAFVFKNTSCELYVNGSGPVQTLSPITNCNSDPTAVLCIGDRRSTGGEPWAGVIDELAVWYSALNATQIANHYAAGIATLTHRTYKRLTGPAQLTGSAADLYTCPTSTRARILDIHASNPTGSPVDLTLSIGADGSATRVYDGYSLGADKTIDDYSPYDLAAGDKIQGWASSAAAVVLTITGWEEPA